MGRSPAFQCYAKDLYTGTSDLSACEFGTYWRGICWSWDNGPLPLDDERRRRVLLLEREEFERVWSQIERLWTRTERGFENARLEEVRREQAAFSKARAKAGRVSGRARRHLRDEHNANITRTSDPTEHPTQSNPASAPSSASALSDLPSASARSATTSASALTTTSPHGRTTNLVNGSDLRRHGSHAWCDHVRSLCITPALHQEFQQRGMKSDADLRAWYPTVIEALGQMPVGDDLFDFWRAAFGHWVGTVAVKAGNRRMTRNEESMAASARVIARLEGRGK